MASFVPRMADRPGQAPTPACSTRHPARPRLAAATAEGVALSDDGGRSWRLPGDVAADRPVRPLGPVLSLASVLAGDGEVLLAGLPQRGVARLIESTCAARP